MTGAAALSILCNSITELTRLVRLTSRSLDKFHRPSAKRDSFDEGETSFSLSHEQFQREFDLFDIFNAAVFDFDYDYFFFKFISDSIQKYIEK